MASCDADVSFWETRVTVVEGAREAFGGITVGVDVGTTSVKAVAVDRDGQVLARARVSHKVMVPAPDRLEHDAGRAWRQGPRRAYAAVTAGLSVPVAGVAVSAMVPSLTAVDRRGVPVLPGVLYGDGRGVDDATPGDRDDGSDTGGTAAIPDTTGFLRWAVAGAPSARGYWPAQAVATHALSGVPAMDSATAMAFGDLSDHRGWRADRLADFGASVDQMPAIVAMGQPAGEIAGTGTAVAGGAIDAYCDQIVAGATEPGDVLAIFGATLVVWIVVDDWIEVPGLVTIPHSEPGRVLVGGPSNAGALFVDWARRLLRGQQVGPRLARNASADGATGDGRAGDPARVPVWLPYVRGERIPFNDPMLRASVHGLDITQGPAAVTRGAYEASGFVIRRMLDLAGVDGRRVVASGGGTQVSDWMAGVADGTGLPVDVVAVPEGAAYGAAFVARVAAGLEPSTGEAGRWARTGRRVTPDAGWMPATAERYRRFVELGTGC